MSGREKTSEETPEKPPEKPSEKEKTKQVTVRMTVAEKKCAEKLGVYLKKVGKLEEASIAGALRVSLRFTVNEILKSVEAERYA